MLLEILAIGHLEPPRLLVMGNDNDTVGIDQINVVDHRLVEIEGIDEGLRFTQRPRMQIKLADAIE